MIDFDQLVLRPCMGSFGREITFQYQQSGESVSLYGIFDAVSYMQDPISGESAGNVGVIGTRAVVGVRLSDFPEEPVQGDRVLLSSGQPLYVQQVLCDGQGGAHLVLNSEAEDVMSALS